MKKEGHILPLNGRKVLMVYLDIHRKEGQRIGPTWITGKPERILVHRWRASEEAILAGAETVRKDNPGLNVREWKGT